MNEEFATLEQRVAAVEAKLKQIEERAEAERTATLTPDKGHGGPERWNP